MAEPATKTCDCLLCLTTPSPEEVERMNRRVEEAKKARGSSMDILRYMPKRR